MIDSKLWRYILLTALIEITVIIVVAIVLIVYYPALTVYIVIGACVITAIYLWISYYIYRPVFGHEAIEPQDESIGKNGTAITDLKPRGQIKLRNEVWTGRSNIGFISAGTKIKIIDMEGILLIVEPLEN